MFIYGSNWFHLCLFLKRPDVDFQVCEADVEFDYDYLTDYISKIT